MPIKNIIASSDSRSTSVSARSPSSFVQTMPRFPFTEIADPRFCKQNRDNPQPTAPLKQQYLWFVKSIILRLVNIAFGGFADCGLLVMAGLWPMQSIRHKPAMIGRKEYNILLHSFRIHSPHRASLLAGSKRASGKSNIYQS